MAHTLEDIKHAAFFAIIQAWGTRSHTGLDQVQGAPALVVRDGKSRASEIGWESGVGGGVCGIRIWVEAGMRAGEAEWRIVMRNTSDLSQRDRRYKLFVHPDGGVSFSEPKLVEGIRDWLALWNQHHADIALNKEARERQEQRARAIADGLLPLTVDEAAGDNRLRATLDIFGSEITVNWCDADGKLKAHVSIYVGQSRVTFQTRFITGKHTPSLECEAVSATLTMLARLVG